MKRRKLAAAGCALAALVLIGIPLQRQASHVLLNSALRSAIRQDNAKEVALMLARGADPNAIGPIAPSHVSWHWLLDRLAGRAEPRDRRASALGLATGMALSGDFEPNSAHWNPRVISELMAHGAVMDPTDRRRSWGGLTGWTLDGNGFGVTYVQPFSPPSLGGGTGHVYFPKKPGAAIISAFRRAGLSAG